MVTPFEVMLCALGATVLWTCLGYPIARAALPPGGSCVAVAPALGWAVFHAAALPLLLVVGFTFPAVVALAGATLAAGGLMTLRLPAGGDGSAPPVVPPWALALAALAACAPAVAVMPKFVPEGVILAAPAFDHSKVAMIDEMVRLGLPPGNPFFGATGEPSRLAYYYLWHFSAATLALLTGASGWAADVALTWFTAFSSLLLMMALAARIGGRRGAAFAVVVLSLCGSCRPVLDAALGGETVGRLLSSYPGLGGWLVQATWAPQHLAAASCVVLAGILLLTLAETGRRGLAAPLALVVAAAFGSSTWVGGFTLALGATLVGSWLLLRLDAGRRWPFLADSLIAAMLAAALVSPFLIDLFAANQARGGGLPVAVWPYEVLGPAAAAGWRRWLDLPAYWLVLLPVDLPAVYLVGAVGLVTAAAGHRKPAATLGLLALASFAVTWLLASTILSNDLGWRALLPGILVVTAGAAAALSRWLASRSRAALAAAALLAAAGVPDGIKVVANNIDGRPTQAAAAFAWAPELWQAVRRHSAPADRVANNPLFLKDLTPWPINAPWAFLADRRSCYASWAHVRAMTPLSRSQVDELEDLFVRVFAGDGSPEEVRELASRHGCRLIVLTAVDGAWQRDPFAAEAAYRLIDAKPDRWRIYVAASPPEGERPSE